MQKKLSGSLLWCFIAALVMVVGSAGSSYATNGYFSHGYGIESQAMGGAGVALPQSSMDASLNPASMVFVGKRFDLGLSLFNPNREYTVTGNPSGFPGTFPLAPGTVKSDSRLFLMPSFGANWMINDKSSFGVSVYGNGGMNTNYDTATFHGSAPTGVDLMQLFIAPTYSIKIAPKHAIGISALLAYQRFEARGLEAFAASGFSSDPANMTNNGHDNSYGIGVRVGYVGEVLPNLNLGASIQSQTYMTKFDKYAGLFAEQGSFDIPANWTVGLAYKATPQLTFAFDIQEIYYSNIKSINNNLLPNIMTSQLGNDNGAGFGWKDTTIYKAGVQWQSSKEMTWRAGYSYATRVIPESEVLFNILAPGVIRQHVTFGGTRELGNNNAISFALIHAFSSKVSGPNPMEAPGQQNIELKMNQWEASVGYTWRF